MVRDLRLTVVAEDSRGPRTKRLVAEHGLSFLLEIRLKESKKLVTVMVDAGPSAEVMAHNLNVLNFDANKLDAVLLSHGHYDHTGGLFEVLSRSRKQLLVIAHPAIFNQKLVYHQTLTYIGPPYTRSELEERCSALLVRNPVSIIKGVAATGEVERGTEFEKAEGFLNVEDELLKEDSFRDDQGLVVNLDGRGLVVVSGCAHSGIINMVKHAQKMTGVKEVYAVIGGFHLWKARDDRIEATVDALQKMDLKLVAPCHCTGVEAVKRLTSAFGDRCRPLKAGDVVKIE